MLIKSMSSKPANCKQKFPKLQKKNKTKNATKQNWNTSATINLLLKKNQKHEEIHILEKARNLHVNFHFPKLRF